MAMATAAPRRAPPAGAIADASSARPTTPSSSRWHSSASGRDELRAADVALPRRGASTAFVSASLANILLTIGVTLLLVVALDQGPIGVIVGNFTGTLLVYVALVGYRREQLGLQFDRSLLREMNRFGVPLIPTALFLLDHELQRPALPRSARGRTEVGLYSARRAHRLGDGAPAHRVPARPGPRSPTRSRTKARRAGPTRSC